MHSVKTILNENKHNIEEVVISGKGKQGIRVIERPQMFWNIFVWHVISFQDRCQFRATSPEK